MASRRLHWTQSTLPVELNGARVATARIRNNEMEAASPLSRLFVWACARQRDADVVGFQLRPMPSPVLHNAVVRCAVCNENHNVLFPRWHVCPRCYTWVCNYHVGTMPWRPCPRCHGTLGDSRRQAVCGRCCWRCKPSIQSWFPRSGWKR